MVDYTALPGSLDLYELMVNYVAGSIPLSLLIWALIILIAGVMGRLSMKSILVILITYAGTVAVGYLGGWAWIPLALFSLWYMFSNLKRWWDVR